MHSLSANSFRLTYVNDDASIEQASGLTQSLDGSTLGTTLRSPRTTSQ